MKLMLNGQPLDLSSRGNGFAVNFDGRSFDVELLRAGEGWLELLVDGRRVKAQVSTAGEHRWVSVGGRTWLLRRSTGAGSGRGARSQDSGLTAPMPGQVRAVHVSPGEAIRRGQTLVVVEAMKMELRIQSPHDGVVGRVFVKVGESVEREQVLLEVNASPS